jgi:ABC-type multidrug transport system ATPase subunit
VARSTSASALALERVGKTYRRGTPVLVDIDLRVAAGRLIVISGPNGCGKTTLLRIAAGLSRPSTGKVRGLPARAYLRHLGRVRGLPTATAATRAAELLGRLGFVGDPDAPIRTLSKGNAQKVGVAQALLPGPAAAPGLLVLDEPWSGLDAGAQRALDELLGEHVGAGWAVLLTDHGGNAERLLDRVSLNMSGGRLAVAPSGEPAVLVRLLCPQAELDTERVLPDVLAVRPGPGGTLDLRVRGDGSDALLAEVLRLGCSIRSVRTPARHELPELPEAAPPAQEDPA